MHPHPEQGFTLLEILVALAVFGIVGFALLRLFESGLDQLERSQHHTQAALFAQSLFTRLRTQPPKSLATQQGTWAKETYRWQLQLQPYHRDPETESTLVTAALRVTWQPQGVYQIRTVLLLSGET
jgi:type II secretion system protein I